MGRKRGAATLRAEAEAQRFRVAGVTPSAGIVVFNQLDKKKTGSITKEQLSKLFSKMEGFVREDLGKAVDSVMGKLDTDKDGKISATEIALSGHLLGGARCGRTV